MERTDFPTGPGTTGPSNTTNTAGASFGAGTAPGATGGTSTSGSTASRDAGSTESVADRARSLASDAGDQLADVGDTVRDRAGSMKTGLADALESGADKLRNRGNSNMVAAGATTAGSIGVSATARGDSELVERVAGGMQSSADWLRDIDLDGLKSSLEQQAKEHPGRTLLIAAGLGYLVGKAFRN